MLICCWKASSELLHASALVWVLDAAQVLSICALLLVTQFFQQQQQQKQRQKQKRNPSETQLKFTHSVWNSWMNKWIWWKWSTLSEIIFMFKWYHEKLHCYIESSIWHGTHRVLLSYRSSKSHFSIPYYPLSSARMSNRASYSFTQSFSRQNV